MNFLGRGDGVTEGRYEEHSRFDSVINYSANGRLLSVVLPELGAGPNHLIVSPDRMRELSTRLLLTRENLNDVPVYDSRLPPSGWDADKMIRKIRELRELLHMMPIRKGLLNPSVNLSHVEMEIRNRYEIGRSKLQEGSYEEAAGLFCGLGLGLTPSGDDFLCGFMIACHLRRKIEIVRRIMTAVKTENLLSMSFLRYSSEARVSEKVKDFIRAWLNEDDQLEAWMLPEVLAQGETSGFDWLAGFTFLAMDEG